MGSHKQVAKIEKKKMYIRTMGPVTPAYLKPGDTIGIFAPARKVVPDQLKEFKEWVKRMGYKCVESKHLYGASNQYSGTVEERVSDLQQLLDEPSVKAIFAARGGYGTSQLLPLLKFSTIKENPKWLIGFSDVTALHAAFGMYSESVHGVMPYSFCMEPPQSARSFELLFDFLQGEKLMYQLEPHHLNIPGSAKGPLTGGNLSVLYSLSGTPFEPDYRGKILFLEDLDEYLYHIDRILLNFEQRGVFKKIVGMVVGGFSEMHDNEVPFGISAYEIIAEKASKYRLPTLFDFPAGHKKNNFPLIFERFSTLTIEEHTCILDMV